MKWARGEWVGWVRTGREDDDERKRARGECVW